MSLFGLGVVSLLFASQRVDTETPAQQFQIEPLHSKDMLIFESGIAK